MSNRRHSVVMVVDDKVVRKRRLRHEHRAMAQALQRSQGYNRQEARALVRTPTLRAMSLDNDSDYMTEAAQDLPGYATEAK